MSKTVLGEGFYGMFSPPLSFPPPFAALSDLSLFSLSLSLSISLFFVLFLL